MHKLTILALICTGLTFAGCNMEDGSDVETSQSGLLIFPPFPTLPSFDTSTAQDTSFSDDTISIVDLGGYDIVLPPHECDTDADCEHQEQCILDSILTGDVRKCVALCDIGLVDHGRGLLEPTSCGCSPGYCCYDFVPPGELGSFLLGYCVQGNGNSNCYNACGERFQNTGGFYCDEADPFTCPANTPANP